MRNERALSSNLVFFYHAIIATAGIICVKPAGLLFLLLLYIGFTLLFITKEPQRDKAAAFPGSRSHPVSESDSSTAGALKLLGIFFPPVASEHSEVFE